MEVGSGSTSRGPVSRAWASSDVSFQSCRQTVRVYMMCAKEQNVTHSPASERVKEQRQVVEKHRILTTLLRCRIYLQSLKQLAVPSVGKSSLMSGLTGVESVAAAYEFTTLTT